MICIDEANVLMRWVRGGPDMDEDLNALLHFFVQVSCQTLCTVLPPLCFVFRVLIKVAAS